MLTVYFGPSGRKLQPESARARGGIVFRPKLLQVRKRLFNRRTRAERLALLLVELLGRPA
jgi:hypothetical protein